MDEEILEPSGPEPEIDRETLEARLAAAEAENRLYRLAPEMGVSPAAVPYLARLCPVREADGEAQTRAALEKLLADLPGLRQTPGPPSGGFRVGAGVTGSRNLDEELLRTAFGIT